MTPRSSLLAAAALVVAVTISPAQAAVPGQNGKIAFERGRDVWTMNPDGSEATKLTVGGGTFDPAMSPDARRIAFSRGADIWVMNADGSDQRNLTGPANLGEGHPAWSPDGTRIAFFRVTQETGQRIWVMNADGTNPVPLTTSGSAGDSQPAWSPDGRQIAYRSAQNTRAIYVLDVSAPNSGTPYHYPARGTSDHPTWAPDGSAIAFQANRSDGNGEDIYKQAGPGGTAELVATGPAPDTEPSWSPDGTRIAFNSTRGGTNQIWTVGSGGVEQFPQNLSGPATTDSQPDWGVFRPEPVPPPEPELTPEIGETLSATPVKGTVTVKIPVRDGEESTTPSGFIPLDKATELPIGSTFNTKGGTVKLTFAASTTTSATQQGKFRGGLFTTFQSVRNPMTELRLRGAGLSKCSKLPKGGAAAARRRSRRLFANARGRFRTRGRNSTATVRGTRWVQKDTCKGTLTRVTSGKVLVRDLTKRRNIRLKKGQKYLARPPKRR